MKMILVPIGSHGDVHPFIALGMELARRGHQVLVLTNDHFQKLVEKARLTFVSLSTTEEFQELINHPDLWHPSRGARLLFGSLNRFPLRLVYERILEHYEPGHTVVVNSPLGLGARVAQDKFGVPLATVHIAPSSLPSVHLAPVLPVGALPSWSPRWLRRLAYWCGDRLVVDPLVCKELNRFRAELGLPPVYRIITRYWNSPQLVLGLFPNWFAPRQPDWPPQLQLTGFPRFDEATMTDMPAGLEEFLQAGEPPLIFTPGSAMTQGQSFFRAALEACQRLQRRGLFLTGYEDHLPSPLPESVQHFRYVPFSRVFPRAAAVIHHGGIGTTSQALAAGVPQLIMPMGFDQPDNAARVFRLGAGNMLYPKKFMGGNVAAALQPLLTASVRQRCQEIAGWFAGANPIGEACDWLEKLGQESAATAPAAGAI